MSEQVSFAHKIFQLPVKLVDRIRRRGLLNMASWSLYQLRWRYREWSLGIRSDEFSDDIVQGDVGDCNGYEPIDYKCFDIILEHIIDETRQQGFLDYGCGKGRAVVLAATKPFQKVIGLEWSPVLAEVAERNIQRAHKHIKAEQVEILIEDARSYNLPPEITDVFLFNSFQGPVLEDVINRIFESLVSTSRRFRLVYMTPKDQVDPFSKLDWLEEECQLPTGFWEHVTCKVYRSKLEPSDDTR